MQDKNLRTPLHLAASFGHVKVVDILVRYKARLDVVDGVGCTALHDAIRMQRLETTQAFVKAGASLDIKDHQQLIPWNLAALDFQRKLEQTDPNVYEKLRRSRGTGEADSRPSKKQKRG